MSDAHPLGINPSFVNDYGLGDFWINRAKCLRVENGGVMRPLDQDVPYSAYDNGGTIPYTSDFYPQTLASGQAAGYILQSSSTTFPAEDWVFRWDGTGDIQVRGGTFPNQLLTGSGAGNRVVVTTTGASGTSLISLQSTDISNLEIMRASDEAAYDAGQRFRTEFLDQLDDFDQIRFLNWMNANDYNGNVEWADRPKQSNLSYNGRGGVPAEEIIALCNTKAKHAWVTIPHLWSNACIRSFADLWASTANSNLELTVEFSNETWNNIFSQTTWLYDMGERLGYGSERYASGRRFLAQRSREVFRIFSDAFRAAGRSLSKLKKVLCWQSAQGANHFPDLLDWRSGYREVNHYGIAPYVGGNMGDNTNGSTTLAKSTSQVAADLLTEWDNLFVSGATTYHGGTVRDTLDSLAPYGITAACYEAGQHLLDTTSPTLSGLQEHLAAVNLDPGMSTLYQSMVEDWVAQGGGPMNFLGLNWYPSTSGFWGFYSTSMTESPASAKLAGYRTGRAAV